MTATPPIGPQSPYFGKHQNAPETRGELSADAMRFTMFRYLPTGDSYRAVFVDQRGVKMHSVSAERTVEISHDLFARYFEAYDSDRQGWPSELEGR